MDHAKRRHDKKDRLATVLVRGVACLCVGKWVWLVSDGCGLLVMYVGGCGLLVMYVGGCGLLVMGELVMGEAC